MQQRSSAKQTTLQDVEKLMRPVTTQADSSLFTLAITVLSALTTTLESWIARGFLGRLQAASAAMVKNSISFFIFRYLIALITPKNYHPTSLPLSLPRGADGS